MRIKSALFAILIAGRAHAECMKPAALDVISTARDNVASYLSSLDRYAACVKSSSLNLPPLDREKAMREYRAVFPLMQRTVDSYNDAHGRSS